MDPSEAKVVELDARPMLRRKLEPFQIIMDAVKAMDQDDVFVLHATFKPTPLFGVLRMKGLVGKAEQITKDHWISTFVHKKNKHWLEGDQADSVHLADPAPGPSSTRVDPESNHMPKIISLDNRGLEPPKPMIRTLSALDGCLPGDQVKIHNDRVPMFLIEELHALGYPYKVEEQADGSAKVVIHKV